MNNMIRYVKESQQAKAYIALTLCFLIAIVGFMRVGSQASNLKMEEKEPRDFVTGGLGKSRPTNSDVEDILSKIKPELEKQSGEKFDSLEVISHKVQVVAGLNYFVKAKAKQDNKVRYVHLRIYKDLRQNLSLHAYQLDKQEHDQLEYFQ